MTPEQLFGLLQGRNYSPIAAAGILGHAQTESNFDPTASGDNGTSFGLWQEHGPNKTALFSYAQSQGLSPADPAAQVGFLDQQLHSPQYAGVLSALQSAKSPEEAATAFLGFERPAGYTSANPMGAMGAQQRIANAAKLYGGLGGSGGFGGLGATPVPRAGTSPASEEPDDTPQIAAQAPAPQPTAAVAAPNLGMTGLQSIQQRTQGLLSMLAQDQEAQRQRSLLGGGLRSILGGAA